MKNNSKDDSYLLDFDYLPDVDHAALISLGDSLLAAALARTDEKTRGEKEDGARLTLKNYANAHRCLLASIAENDATLPRQRDIAARYTSQTISWMIAAHENRVSASSMATLLRSLIGFARVCAPSVDLSLLREQAQRFEAQEKRDGPRKVSYAIKPSELPQHMQEPYARLAAGGASVCYNTGEFRRYLGAQKAAGVDITAMELAFLATPEAVANFERIIPANETLDQRLNALGCMLTLADNRLNVRPIFDRAGEIRKAASTNPDIYERRAVEFDELPDEAKARFNFVTAYDGRLSFNFGGQDITLPKARCWDGMEFSETHIDAMALALRHLYTILRAADSFLANDFMRWGEREAINLFQQFYADSDFITQTSRLEECVSALRAIYGDADRQMFAYQRRQMKLTHALRKLLDDKQGFDLRAAGKMEEGSDVEARDPPSTQRLRLRARAIAFKVLQRLRDLKNSSLPYRDLSRLAALFRTALVVALLAEHPIRLRALTALTTDHLKKPKPMAFVRAATTAPRYGLNIPGALTKSGAPFRGTLSVGLTGLFDMWFDEVRPLLLNGRPEISAVFISDNGRSLSRSVFQKSIPAFSAAVFQFRINVHLFRTLHGTELVGDREAAARRLHHGNRDSQIAYQDGATRRDQDRSSSLQQQTQGFFDSGE